MEGLLDSKTFVEELRWCIDQLELGLQRQSPNSRQAVESIKVLKILKSQKAPMVKKRQVMRNTFGDYRKKMKEAEKKSLSGLRHSRFQPLGVGKTPMTSRFLKMSHHKQQNVDHVRGDLDQNLRNLCLQSSESEQGASQNAAELTSDQAGELVYQASHGSLDSTRECLTNNSTFSSFQDNLQKGVQSSNQIYQVPEISTSLMKTCIETMSDSNNCGDKLQSFSNHVNQSNNSSSFSLTDVSSSSSNSSSALRKQANNFKYEPSVNSFSFDFDNSQNGVAEGSSVIDTNADGPDLGQLSLAKVNEKTAANIYKYDKSENDFCFNFEEASDKL